MLGEAALFLDGKEDKLGDSLSNLSHSEHADDLTQFTGNDMESGLSVLKSQINVITAKKAESGEICKDPEQPTIPNAQISDKHSHGFDHFEHHSQFTDDLSQGKFAFHVK